MKLRFSQLLCVVILAGAFLVISDGYAQTKTGLASYYGPELAGLPTASGEPFNPYGFTAAHRTLPLGTKLIVSYGGRSVEVTVNDRGPYSGGRAGSLAGGGGLPRPHLRRRGLRTTPSRVATVPEAIAAGRLHLHATGGLSQAPAAQFSSNGQSGTYVVQAGDTLYGIAAELVPRSMTL